MYEHITFSSNFTQSLLQVSDDVIRVFVARGDSQEIVVNAKHFSVCLWNRTMGHECGRLNKSLNITQTLSECDQLQAGHELACLLNISLDVKREHAAATRVFCF